MPIIKKLEAYFCHCTKFIQPLEIWSTFERETALKALARSSWVHLHYCVGERDEEKKEMLHGVEVVCLGAE